MYLIRNMGILYNISKYNMSNINNYPKKLLVCHMAGTTINEKGIVYETIFKTVKPLSTEITKDTINKWHGVKKIDVLQYFADKYNGNIEKLNNEFNKKLLESYNPDNVNYIHPSLSDYFSNLRNYNIIVALNTSYPKQIQEHLIKTLKLDEIVDDWICADDVIYGRPQPDMIYKLMSKHNIKSTHDVCKVDDTVIGIKEGKNAQCYKVCGVLSGGDTKDELLEAGADIIYPSIVDVDINTWFDTNY